MTNKIKHLSVKELFSEDSYSIPIYQRNYAWSIIEVRQLIQDVANAAVKRPKDNYYIGSLIVDRHKDGVFETIDGQQRLTTLFIILCALKKLGAIKSMSFFNEIRLIFAHRENSQKSLDMIFHNGGVLAEDQMVDDSYERHILDIFDSTVKELSRYGLKSDNSIDIESFVEHLLSKVIILRIEVPEEIDKNHYFEVMNSRGVQLEQHEIVKAKLMAELSPADRKTFEIIWEACSDMDRFLQINFGAKCREVIFGPYWTDTPKTNFQEISDAFSEIITDQDEDKKDLRTLIAAFNENSPVPPKKTDTPEDIPDREHFHSIINFPSFLLHVLKVLCPNFDVPFYDKWLTETFDKVLEQVPQKRRFVKQFASCLLQCRYLLDTYIIKRNLEDAWGIFGIETSESKGYRSFYPKGTFNNPDIIDSGNELVMVLSMFHFAMPSMNYKNWLSGALKYLYETTTRGQEINYQDYLDHMISLAKAYMLDWYFGDGSISLMEIIHTYGGIPQTSLTEIGEDRIRSIINNGINVDAFVFNFYDYLIWKEKQDDKEVKEFRFTYRTSVEHFFPQHPSEKSLTLPTEFLDSFGNLCLISTSMNSRFSNLLPAAKFAQFGKEAKSLSLKLQEMFNEMEDNGSTGQKWYKSEIKKAEDKAIDRFMKYLSSC